MEEGDHISGLEAEFAELIVDISIELADGTKYDYLGLIQVFLRDLKWLSSWCPMSTFKMIRVEKTLINLHHIVAIVQQVLEVVLKPSDFQLLCGHLFELRST